MMLGSKGSLSQNCFNCYGIDGNLLYNNFCKIHQNNAQFKND